MPATRTSKQTPGQNSGQNTAQSNGRRIILISDGTGETAAQMTKAAMVQFSDQEVFFVRYKNVRHEAQIEAICDDAATGRDLIIYTIVSPTLRSYLTVKAREKTLPAIDLLGPLLVGLGNYFGFQPRAVAGLLHDVNEAYFDRIAAMEYTIAHDDGRDLSDLEKADLVILGISRTSKTPLSMYLSHQGWKVANIPLIQGFEIPKELLTIDQRRVVCLTIDPENLATIRRARLERLGHDRGGEYADPEKVNQEIEYANDLYRKNRRWPVFNVTGKALEETAAEIIKLMAARRLTPAHSLENLGPATETIGTSPEKSPKKKSGK
jgi:[pyruvate, water dikinase]-phosphate phosphotransferase / [pyruvate, water dikinase] kinase